MAIFENDYVDFLPKETYYSTNKKMSHKIEVEFQPIEDSKKTFPYELANTSSSKILSILENSMASDETIEFNIIYKNDKRILNNTDSPEYDFLQKADDSSSHHKNTKSKHTNNSDSPKIQSEAPEKDKFVKNTFSNPEGLTSIKKNPFILEKQFKISASFLKTESLDICVLHCFGEIYQSNRLILNLFFKFYLTDPNIYVIVDMAEVTYVENKIWEYLALNSLTIQKLNGILIFSGIHEELYSTLSGFSKKNICCCETVESCMCVIENLIPGIGHTKILSTTNEQNLNKKPEDETMVHKSVSINADYTRTIDQSIESEGSLSELILTIIKENGPCSFFGLKKLVNKTLTGSEKINIFMFYRILKTMNIETTKKRIRYFRSS